MELKRSARLTAIPQLDIPDILVDDEDDRAAANNNNINDRTRQSASAMSRTPSTFLSAEDARAAAAHHHRTWSGTSVDISLHETNYAHPLSTPRAAGSSVSGPLSPTSPHRHNMSAFSFELQEPQGGSGSGDNGSNQPGSTGSSRRGSAVSPAQVRDLLDDSIWVESIRRSATQRKSGWAP